jgi:hypothetical protein
MNIITSLCIDSTDDSFNFQLYHVNNQQKRLIYWKCCATLFATVLRCMPNSRKILYTNDEDEVFHERINIKELIKQFGVEIVYISSDELLKFKNKSKYHFPTLYKFLVLKEIAKLDGNSLFLDSDCVWLKPFENENADWSIPVLYNMYQKSDIHDKRFNNLSRAEMGEVFSKIDPSFPVTDPILFGGEIVGGNRDFFEKVSIELWNCLNHLVINEINYTFPNGKTLFDGDEYLSSLIYYKHFQKYREAGTFIKRVWTSRKVNNTTLSDLNLTIWHMISEKQKGIPLLFDQVVNSKSAFWTTPLSKFNLYLGSYLNVPKRQIKLGFLLIILIFIQKVVFKLRKYFSFS